MPSSKSQRFECGFDSCVVTRGFDLLQTCNLSIPHRDVVDIARVNRIFGSEFVFVHANDHILTRVNPRLFLCGGGFDFEFGPTAVNRFGHAAHGFHFFNDGPGFVRHFLGERLHHVATSPGVDDVGDVGFFLDDELGVAGNARRKLGGQCDRLIKAVGVQRLGATKDGGHGFDRGTHDVVVRVLLGQTPATGLAVGAQHQALRIFGVKAFHDAAPQQSGSAHFGNL